MTAEIVGRLTESFGQDEAGHIIMRLPDDLIARAAQSWGIGFEEPDRTMNTIEALLAFLDNQFPVETLDIYHYRLSREIDVTSDGDQKQKLVDAANKYVEKKWPNIVFTLSPPLDGRRRLIMETRRQ